MSFSRTIWKIHVQTNAKNSCISISFFFAYLWKVCCNDVIQSTAKPNHMRRKRECLSELSHSFSWDSFKLTILVYLSRGVLTFSSILLGVCNLQRVFFACLLTTASLILHLWLQTSATYGAMAATFDSSLAAVVNFEFFQSTIISYMTLS